MQGSGSSVEWAATKEENESVKGGYWVWTGADVRIGHHGLSFQYVLVSVRFEKKRQVLSNQLFSK